MRSAILPNELVCPVSFHSFDAVPGLGVAPWNSSRFFYLACFLWIGKGADWIQPDFA